MQGSMGAHGSSALLLFVQNVSNWLRSSGWMRNGREQQAPSNHEFFVVQYAADPCHFLGLEAEFVAIIAPVANNTQIDGSHVLYW